MSYLFWFIWRSIAAISEIFLYYCCCSNMMSYFALGRNEKLSWFSLSFDVVSRRNWKDTYCSCNRDTRWDFASSENNDNVVFSVMEQRHEEKLEWLLKEIRSPKENCKLSREAFLMFWFFVGSSWNTNPTIRICEFVIENFI